MRMLMSGELPKTWKTVRVGEVFEFSRKSREHSVEEDSTVPFIPMEGISEDSKHVSSWVQKKIGEITSGTFVFKDDLIVAKITPSFENGKQALLTDLPVPFGYATTEVLALHPRNEMVLGSHLYHFLKINRLRNELAAKMEGSTGRQRLPSHVLADLEIPLPPLAEQKQIDFVLSAIQEAKEKIEAVIEATKQLKMSLMKYLFTYGPVPVEEAEKVKLKETEIGIVPEEWPLVELDHVIKLTSGKSRPQEINDQKSGTFEYPVYGGNGIMGFSQEYLIDQDTVVLGRVGEYCGAVYISRGKSWISDNALYAKKFLSDQIDLEFLALYLELLNLNRLKKKSGQPLITQSIVYSQSIPMPNANTQKIIVHMLNAIDTKIQAEKQKFQSLLSLFQTLLNDLMTGEIRTSNLEFGP